MAEQEIPETVLEALEYVRGEGATNMLARSIVIDLADAAGYDEAIACWKPTATVIWKP